MNFNKAIVLGRITQAPDLRKTPSGQSVASFGIATNRAWTDKNGHKQETTEFHNIVAWGKLAELASTYLTKGSLALVEGRLETRSWEDKDGNPRRTTQIIAEGMQFGPRPGNANVDKPTVENAKGPAQHIEGDEEDTGRDLNPLFDEDEIKPEDIPF